MDRKEKVLSYIKSKEYIPLKAEEMAVVLDVPYEDIKKLSDILNSLCSDGSIYLTKKGRYMPADGKSAVVSGILSCNAKGYFGFVLCEGEDVFVSGDDMSDALNGDKVLVRLDNSTGDRRQGHIIRVLERGNDIVVGVIYKEKDGYFYMRPDNRQIYTKISIAPDKMMNAKIGDRVSVKPVKYSPNGKVFGEVDNVLGEENNLKSCIEGIILENGIKQEFDAETLLEAEKTPDKVTDANGREDLRNILAFTIDGDDARDFDDAVSLEVNENGNYILGVHIADVSEYVTENSALDREAYERGTSVYLADRVIPMLPERLSNGICSLNPDEDRFTLSLFMEISSDGSVLNHRLVKAVIRSKERMTYNNVNSMLEDNDDMLCEKYSHILPVLKRMEELARILLRNRIKRGAIQFDFPESHIVVNENGEPVEIERENRGVSNKMIEEFMLIANETVAEYAFWSEIPFVYRNHEPPSEEKIISFNKFLINFGLFIKGKIDRDNPVKPKALQQVLDKVNGAPEERMISRNMLQSLMKARYSDECMGHFGLSSKYYCHFTSPIRRYPDLLVHRILKLFIDGKLTGEKAASMRGYTARASARSSDCEVNAEHTERDTDDLMKAAYMHQFVGESFDGVVSGVTSFGMFVELENSVEGLIRLENMSDDYYEFDENAQTLTGKRKKRIYTVGNAVRVVLVNTDILLRQIDFVLEHDYSAKISARFQKKDIRPLRKTLKRKQNYRKRKRNKNG